MRKFNILITAWLVGVTSVLAAEPRVSYLGHSQVRIIAPTQAQIDAIEQSGAKILNCHIGHGPLQVVASAGQLDDFRRAGIEFEVQIADVEESMTLQRQSNAQRSAVLGGGDPFDDFFLDYREYNTSTGQILWYMNELVARYPNLAELVTVGTTLQGRSIVGIRVTNQATTNKPGVVYFGAEHAREWITTTVPTYFANYLLSNYGTDSQVTELVDNVEFYLVPVFNVDGYLYTWSNDRLWRKNRRNNGNGTFGVDINRNWGAGWGGQGSSGSGNSETFRGTSAFSEPETQAMRDFFINHPNVRAQLDIHCFSQLILWPYGYQNALPADQDYYSEVGLGMEGLIEGVYGTQFTSGPIYSTIYPASGGSCDWTYDARGILSFSFELRDTGFFQFELPADQIVPSNLELIDALLLLSDSSWVRDPIRFKFPNGLPERITAGTATTIDLEVVSQLETVGPEGVKMFYRMNPNDSFSEVPMTATGGGGYEAGLPGGDCGSSPEFYFTAHSSGGTTIRSPEGAPSQGAYTASVVTGSSIAFESVLSSNPGWTTQGQWAFGVPTGGGGSDGSSDPTSGHTGTTVYGYNLNGDYANNIGEQHLTSGPINCTGKEGLRLSYWRWLGVESDQWDHASIRVSTNGTNWTTVWQNSGEVADSQWTLHEVDLGGIADNQPAVYLRWTMGPTDTAVRYCGWNIDDIQLLADQCAQWSMPLGDPSGISKSRFISFEVPPVASGTAETALRINLVSLHRVVPPYSGGPSVPFSAFEGGVRWVGPPTQYVESTASGIPFWTSSLQCTPHYQDWSTAGLLHVTGSAIVPSSTYEVINVAASCMGSEAGCTSVSPPLVLQTTRWSDAVSPFAPPDGSVQPDITDVSSLIDKFRNAPSAPIKARALLAGAPGNPFGEITPEVLGVDLGFSHISACVDAFRGAPYPFTIAACP